MSMNIQAADWNDLLRVNGFEAVQFGMGQIESLLKAMGGRFRGDAARTNWYVSNDGSLEFDLRIVLHLPSCLEYYEKSPRQGEDTPD
jgi:hypothetical protein